MTLVNMSKRSATLFNLSMAFIFLLKLFRTQKLFCLEVFRQAGPPQRTWASAAEDRESRDPTWIFKHGTNIVNRGLKVLFFGLFMLFFGLFFVGFIVLFSVFFANFRSC